jgi:CHASE2 domain-containing sensor protein
MIVMREPVPDRVAQEFLKHLLSAFAGGKPLYLSVREARERLQGLEDHFPCATWLPVICQNSAEVPPTWQDLVNGGVLPPTEPVADIMGDRSKSASKLTQSLVRLRALVRQIRTQWFVVLVSLIVTVGLMGVRPVVQSWDLNVYDQMMQQRPDEGIDPRLLIVEVTDADIEAQQQNGELLQRRSQSAQSFNQSVKISLSDTSLNQLLGVLEKYHPRAIGLDIYRDFSVQNNQAKLATRLRQTSGLITVCKAEDFNSSEIPSIDPPPEVPLDRVGFSDFREDSDSVLRRHLLGMLPLLHTQGSRCNIDRAFSVNVAAQYLNQQQVKTQFTANGDLQLGDRVINILRPDSGYPLSQGGGSEILLNYRSTEVATRVTLQQVLKDQVNPEYIKDKIVLVGVTAQGGEDDWLTPINSHTMPGVVVQAHMISQLLSAALDQRPILTVLSQGQAIAWTWTWAIIGGVLASWQWRQRRMRRPLRYQQSSVVLRIAVGIATATGILYSLCFVGLLKGRWLPFSSSLLALILCGSIVVIYSTYRSRNQSTFHSNLN